MRTQLDEKTGDKYIHYGSGQGPFLTVRKPLLYKVVKGGGRWAYGFTLDEAVIYAGKIYQRTGNVAAIEKYHGR